MIMITPGHKPPLALMAQRQNSLGELSTLNLLRMVLMTFNVESSVVTLTFMREPCIGVNMLVCIAMV